jgi:DNA-binding CsgD family transcriptional regulator
VWLVSIWPVAGNLPFELRPGKYLLGRARTCDIKVCDMSVSRQHASVSVDAIGNSKIQDLGSRNGINGGTTKNLILHEGDEFKVGEVRLVVLLRPTRTLASSGQDEDLTNACLQGHDNQRTLRIDSAVLTPAQSKVLDLAVKGLSQKEIADELKCKYYTVHTHFKAIYKALGVHSRAELHTKFPILWDQK